MEIFTFFSDEPKLWESENASVLFFDGDLPGNFLIAEMFMFFNVSDEKGMICIQFLKRNKCHPDVFSSEIVEKTLH